MRSLGFIKTETVGIVEILTNGKRYYYFSQGRKFPIKKSVVEAGEPHCWN